MYRTLHTSTQVLDDGIKYASGALRFPLCPIVTAPDVVGAGKRARAALHATPPPLPALPLPRRRLPEPLAPPPRGAVFPVAASRARQPPRADDRVDTMMS